MGAGLQRHLGSEVQSPLLVLKADPCEEVQKQIGVGEANVEAKGLKTTW